MVHNFSDEHKKKQAWGWEWPLAHINCNKHKRLSKASTLKSITGLDVCKQRLDRWTEAELSVELFFHRLPVSAGGFRPAKCQLKTSWSWATTSSFPCANGRHPFLFWSFLTQNDCLTIITQTWRKYIHINRSSLLDLSHCAAQKGSDWVCAWSICCCRCSLGPRRWLTGATERRFSKWRGWKHTF